MWLRHSLAVVAAVACVSGCSSGDSKTYSATEVADALRNHGFGVGEVAQSDRDQAFREVFPQLYPEGVQSILEQREGRPRPEGKGALVLSALIFNTPDKASCDEPNVIGICVQRGNVVVVARGKHATAAREAVDDLR